MLNPIPSLGNLEKHLNGLRTAWIYFTNGLKLNQKGKRDLKFQF